MYQDYDLQYDIYIGTLLYTQIDKILYKILKNLH